MSADLYGTSLLGEIMPEKLSRVTKHEALALLQNGSNQAHAASVLGISDRTIRRVKSKAKNYGDIEGGRKKAGRKPKLSAEMEEVFWY